MGFSGTQNFKEITGGFTSLLDSITELEFPDVTYPSNRNNIVTDENTTSKFRLDTGLVQHLLKI